MVEDVSLYKFRFMTIGLALIAAIFVAGHIREGAVQTNRVQ